MERTLPSVAEMLKSTPTSNTIPAYHHAALPGNAAVTLGSSSLPSASLEQSYNNSELYASHASPTESATSTSSSERQYHQQPLAQLKASGSMKHFGSNGISSQTPVNVNGRHDSAIAPQSFSYSPDEKSRQPNQVTNDHHRPASRHHPMKRSPGFTASRLTNSPSSVQQQHIVQRPPAASSSPRLLTPPLASDAQSTSKRYNVRFAANHTPSTMPSAQKSRPSPPSQVAQIPRNAPTPNPVPQLDASPREIEPAIQVMLRNLRPADEPSQQPSVERCPRCDEAWSRPIPDPAKWNQDSPADNPKGYAEANMYIITQLEQHTKAADLKYVQWKERHSHCPDRATSPDILEPILSSNSSVQKPPMSGPTHTSSNKRKSEILLDQTSKSRKVEHGTPEFKRSVRPASPI